MKGSNGTGRIQQPGQQAVQVVAPLQPELFLALMAGLVRVARPQAEHNEVMGEALELIGQAVYNASTGRLGAVCEAATQMATEQAEAAELRRREAEGRPGEGPRLVDGQGEPMGEAGQ